MKKLRLISFSLIISFVFVLGLPVLSFGYALGDDEKAIQLYEKTYSKEPNPLKSDKKLYPLSGEVTYGTRTKEQVDYAISQGYYLAAEDKDGNWWDSEKNYEKYLETVVGDKGLTETAVDTPVTLDGDANAQNHTTYILDLAGLYDGKLTETEQQIRDLLAEYLNSFDWKNASEYERADRAIRFIAERCDYSVYRPAIKGGLWDCLFSGETACEGFTDTFYMLSRCTGLNVITAMHTSHAWAYVEIDGKWYDIDLDGDDDENLQRFIDRGPCTLDQVLEFAAWSDRGRIKINLR